MKYKGFKWKEKIKKIIKNQIKGQMQVLSLLWTVGWCVLSTYYVNPHLGHISLLTSSTSIWVSHVNTAEDFVKPKFYIYLPIVSPHVQTTSKLKCIIFSKTIWLYVEVNYKTTKPIYKLFILRKYHHKIKTWHKYLKMYIWQSRDNKYVMVYYSNL